MFSFFKRKKDQESTPDEPSVNSPATEDPETSSDTNAQETATQNTETAALEQETNKSQDTDKDAAAVAPDTSATASVTTPAAAPASIKAAEPQPVAVEQPKEKPTKTGFFARIRQGLSKTRSGLTDGLANLLLGKKAIDDDLLEELETQLILADVGVEATNEIMLRLTER